jgi:hypothetical protein
VLLEKATNEDAPAVQGQSARVQAALDAQTELVACAEGWCLYRTRR